MTDHAVRPFQPADRDAVRRIACDTAEAGRPLPASFAHRAFFADLLTSYYTDHEAGSCWVATDAGGAVVGYLSGCLDTRRYLRFVTWRLSPLALVRALAGGLLFSLAFWRFLLAGILTGMRSGSYHHHWMATHPAHLHINLIPSARAAGLGRALLDAFLGQARAAGAAGVHLGARGDNVKGRGFFEKMGFQVLETPRIVDPFTLEERTMVAYGRSLR